MSWDNKTAIPIRYADRLIEAVMISNNDIDFFIFSIKILMIFLCAVVFS